MRKEDVEGETERMMFAVNPEMWNDLYNKEQFEGEVIREPGSPDEFRQMLEDWDDAGFEGFGDLLD